MNRCRTCRGLMVEVFEDDADNPGLAKLAGWRCLKCGIEVKEPAVVPPPLNPTWLQGSPSPQPARAPRMIYSLHDGLRRRMTGGSGSPFGSPLQVYADSEEPNVRAAQRHWWA